MGFVPIDDQLSPTETFDDQSGPDHLSPGDLSRNRKLLLWAELIALALDDGASYCLSLTRQ
jgi:hypothetical protein